MQLGGWARCWQILTVKTGFVTKYEHVPPTWTDTFVQSKKWKRDMRFGTSKVRGLYRSGSLTTIARELVRCKLDWVYRRLGGTKGAW